MTWVGPEVLNRRMSTLPTVSTGTAYFSGIMPFDAAMTTRLMMLNQNALLRNRDLLSQNL